MDQTVVSTLNSRLAHTFVAALALALMSTAIATVPVAAAPGDAPVTGSFFVDTSRDGALDPGEAVADTDPLFPPNGVSVTAYDGEGNSVVGAVTPGTPPTYSIDPSSLDGQGYRLEFELNPADVTAGWAFTVHGPDSASSTQFVDAGDIADIGVVPPSSCRGGDGSLMFSCFALDGLVDTLVTSDYDTGNKVNNALEGDTGSVWGVAYDEWTDRLFTSAVIRNPFDLGSQGPAGLYIQTAGGAWSGFDLGAVFLNGYDPSTASVEDAASATARIGIGDIDLSDDGRTLFVSNIATSSIHVYDVSTGVPVQQTVVPVGDPGCAAGDSHRIWATKSLSSTSLLVGAVCTAEVTNNAANLTGHILEVSTAGTVTPVPGLSPIPLNYQRGCATQGAGCSGVFEPWTDSSAYIRSEAIGPFFGAEWNNVQQPMISDIEVSESGDILVGISDRTAYQHLQGTMWDDSSTPGVNEGDLGPMAMGSGGDLLFMENTGTVAAPSYVLDPAISVGGGSEYFSWDVSQYNIHREITSGAAWVHPAKNEVVATVMDPIVVNTMGLITSNLDSASKVNAYEVGGNARVYKAGGLGDIEGCFKPIEIGDRVWLDLDNDGVQDPDELALAGVTVTITGPGLPAGGVTAVTNADGIWTFDSIDGLLPSTAYTVTVDVSTNTTALPPGFTNADLFETVANSTAPGGNGENDSNVSGGTMTVTTPAAGSNDHSFDAGYSLPFDQALEKTLTSFDIDTRTAVFEIEVTNQGAPIETFSVTDYLGAPTAGMWEDFNGTANPAGTTGGDQALPYTWDGSVAQAPVVSVSGGLGTGESVTIPITLRWTDPLPTGAAINNWAEISNFDDDNNPSNGDASSGDLTDADSTPDGDQTNDAQPAAAGDPTDGVIDNTAGDEDDHDVAGVQWWDLTLIKERSASQPYVVDYTTTPPTISFDITVANQGTETATAIGVTDYLPAGTVYTTGTAPAMPAGVTDNGDGTFDIATLDPGDAVTFSIVLDITDLSAPLFTNGAEIDSFLDVNGNPQPDIDSTPDAVNSDPIISNPADLDDPTNSHNDIDYDPDADGNLSEPTPGDEDDHDIETVVPPFDQALQKTLDAFQPSLADGVQVGDLVTYTLTVTNQGAPIQLVEVIDYLPTGLSYSSANQSTAPLTDSGDGDSFAIAWDGTDPIATLTGDSFDPLETLVIPLVLEVDASWSGLDLVNWAEISNFDDDQNPANGDAASGDLVDSDSTPDATDGNDPAPAAPNAPGDNTITGNGDGTDPVTGDEDDHDVAGLPVWDLSLIKERSASQPYVVDYTTTPPTISFDITVVNQGSEVATAIGVTDYLPAGTVYTTGTAPAMPAGVTDNGDGTFDIATLDPGDTVTFTLILDVVDYTQTVFVNGAEIDSFLDVNGTPQPDSDSTPDATNTDPISTDPANVDNPDNSHNDPWFDPDGDGNHNEATPGDEDDHDIEVVVAPYDLALAKTIDLNQPALADGVQQGDIIVWDLTITNQAAPVQTIDITDYPPAGLTFAQADQAAAPVTDSGNAESFTVTWDAANPVVTLAGDSLDFGESVTVPIALEVGPAWDGSAIINWAEISNFDTDQNPANGDAASGDLADIDSTPDDTQANDTQPTGPNAPGDNEITGNGDGTDPVTGDEDDHDVAGIPFWDLSLIKERSAGQPYVVDYTVSPPTISYDITVTNQGSEVATAIGVTDYLPTGTAYTAGTAPTMPATTDGGAAVVITDNGDGTFAIDTLDPGDMVTFTMILDVTDLTQDEFVNGAEIDSFLDVNGNPQPDSDSTPDAINDDDVLDDPTNADNPANSHNDPAYDHDGDGNVNEATPGDEDDHDVEVVVPPYDLALSKVVDTAATVFPLAPGDPVTFTITVTNQGRSVTDFDVTDYIDTTLWDAFDPAVNPAATTTGDVALPFTWLATDPANPVAKVTGQLLPTQSISIPVTLTIRADYSASNGSALENWAEISSFDDDGNPATPGPTDVDSTPDGTQSDDAQPAGPGEPGDDVITGNGDGTDPVTGDEDDHDVAGVEIFDLALLKTLNPATTLPVVHGAPVTFDITVINQGSVHATNISVIDYVDLAMWDAFDASINPAGTTTGDQALAYAWTAAGTDGSVALTGSLAPGGSVTIPVTLTIQPTADLQTLINTAEVSAADAVDATGVTVTNPDGSPLTDIDSVPDTTNSDPQPQNPGDPTDNVVDNSDGDEDDHDIASVVPPTYSLGNQVWFDADNNGLVDPGEAPASGVVVELWEDTDGDGQPDALVGTMTTDTSGLYLFDGLEPGDYVVVLPESNFADGGPLENWWSSTPTSTDPNDGVDQDDNGIDQTSPTGDYFVQSGAVAVGPFSPTSEAGPDNDPTTPDNHENLTVDFGFTQFSLGNQVWADENNDGVLDPTEDPISGVLVHLFTDADGDGEADDTNGDGVIDATDALATDTTDADGGYLFTGLPTGDYIVGIAPENWASGGALENMLSSDPTETDPNTDVDDDDNGVPCNCPDAYVFSGPTTLAGGEPTNEPGLGNDSATFDGNSNLTVDFGFHQPTFDLALKKTLLDGTNTATVNVGDVVTFTITVYNQGNVTAENIEVVDYLPSGLELSDGDWTLDTNGNARTTLAGPIAPGASVDVDLTARVLPSGELGNIAEIAGATPLNPDGTTMVLPSGALFPDADSVADDSNSETPVDDEINNASGDEDDHDGATLVLAATTSTPLAFTGSDSRTLALQALMLIVLGGSLAVFGSRRRREI